MIDADSVMDVVCTGDTHVHSHGGPAGPSAPGAFPGNFRHLLGHTYSHALLLGSSILMLIDSDDERCLVNADCKKIGFQHEL